MKLTYMHQIMRDTGRNKPFEPRHVAISGTHYGPSQEIPFDCFVVKCDEGEFTGLEGAGNTWQEAMSSLAYGLMDASRKAFEKADGYTLKAGVSVPIVRSGL